jgi:hypothetical protein
MKRLPPDTEELLTQRLELTRDKYRMDQRAEPLNAARRAAKQHMKVAREELAKVKTCLGAYLTDAINALGALADYPELQHEIDISRRVLADQIKQIDAADELLDHLITLSALEERNNGAHRWQTHAISVFEDVREALATVGIDLGVRAGGGKKGTGPGPAGRLFELMVPLLTGETTTAGSAARQLSDARSKRRKIAPLNIPR